MIHKYRCAKKFYPAILILSLALTACGRDDAKSAPEQGAGTGTSQSSSLFPVARIEHGATLFAEHCAQCHGPQAQGHPDWERGRAQGFVAAPPLDGNGTVTKLSKTQMKEIIKEGVKRSNKFVMPSWKGRVKQRDIEDIIIWYQALWPPEVYEKWRKVQPVGES